MIASKEWEWISMRMSFATCMHAKASDFLFTKRSKGKYCRRFFDAVYCKNCLLSHHLASKLRILPIYAIKKSSTTCSNLNFYPLLLMLHRDIAKAICILFFPFQCTNSSLHKNEIFSLAISKIKYEQEQTTRHWEKKEKRISMKLMCNDCVNMNVKCLRGRKKKKDKKSKDTSHITVNIMKRWKKQHMWYTDFWPHMKSS